MADWRRHQNFAKLWPTGIRLMRKKHRTNRQEVFEPRRYSLPNLTVKHRAPGVHGVCPGIIRGCGILARSRYGLRCLQHRALGLTDLSLLPRSGPGYNEHKC